jgi:hypothetical protein
MKKSLFALAAVGAFTGAAQAQSSVTVYGTLDAAVTQATNKYTASGVVTTQTSRTTANGDGALSTSLFGLRGTEDLGGGNRASFVLEYDLIDIGSGGTGANVESKTSANTLINGTANANTVSAAGFGARQSWLGLSTNMGELRIGRQFSVMHSVFMAGSAGAGNNMAGAVYSSGTNAAVNDSSVRPYDVFIDRAITYRAPVVSGIQLELQGSAQYITSGETVAATANSQIGAAVTYTGVKNLTAAYSMVKVGINSVTATSGDTNLTTHVVAANYNFGPVQAFGNWSTRTLDWASGANAAKTTNSEIGFRAPVTPTIGLWASAFTGQRSSGLSSNTATTTVALASGQADTKGFQVGATYAFSKRTTAYGIFGSQEIKGKAAQNTAKVSSEGLALGLRHTF